MTDFFCRWGVISWEVVRMDIVLQEEWFKVCQRILFAKQAPDTVLGTWIAVIELSCFHLCKLFYQCLVDGKMLLAVFPWGFVLVFPDALLQERCHLEMRITKQGRNANDRSYYLSIECSTTIANQ